VAGPFEHGTEPSGFMKGGEFLISYSRRTLDVCMYVYINCLNQLLLCSGNSLQIVNKQTYYYLIKNMWNV
jgi:hypothetical protein